MNADRSSPDYIDRTIATVRNHRNADNCWPQWANIFADEIEALRSDLDAERALRQQAEQERDEALAEATRQGAIAYVLRERGDALISAGSPLRGARPWEEALAGWQEPSIAAGEDRVARLETLGNALANHAAEYVSALDTGAPDRKDRCLRYVTALREWRKALAGDAETKEQRCCYGNPDCTAKSHWAGVAETKEKP